MPVSDNYIIASFTAIYLIESVFSVYGAAVGPGMLFLAKIRRGILL